MVGAICCFLRSVMVNKYLSDLMRVGVLPSSHLLLLNPVYVLLKKCPVSNQQLTCVFNSKTINSSRNC